METLYERVGGDAFFVDLVDRFYADVAQDPVLQPLYEDELADARHWLTEFLVQYWGGPRRYDDARGHPRLRMRHAPFAIGEQERDRWWTHMSAAVRASQLAPDDEAALLGYFANAAAALRNR